MAIANEANSGGRHPAVLTSDANAADRPLCVVDVGAGAGSCGGAHSAVPALDSEILSAVRACNGYPKRSKQVLGRCSAVAMTSYCSQISWM